MSKKSGISRKKMWDGIEAGFKTIRDGDEAMGIMSTPTCGNASTLGELTVNKKSRPNAGSCNFCTKGKADRMVYEIVGAQLSVRVCARCAKVIRKGLKCG